MYFLESAHLLVIFGTEQVCDLTTAKVVLSFF